MNGQRPNSNNITIDGVANIDTGDNGGNMATTNIDAVAEFKILTNAYQAEYGRAVGGQLQVVTKSGSQNFHGSGYWYGRRSDWDANTYLNKRETPEVPKSKTSRNDSGYTIGGPVAFPGFNQDKKKLFFFWSQEFQRRSNPANVHQTRVPTALERRGDFSQSVDSSGNPFPFIRDFSTGLPCSATDTRGCFQDGGVLGRIPANRLYAPGLAALSIFPQANFSGGSGLNFTSQDPDSPKRREELLRMDFQPTDTWRVTGRYMNNKEDILQAYGTTWAGNGSDQLPMPTLFVHPGSNYMLSASGILNSTTSLELSWGRAANSLNYQLQQQQLFRANAGVSSLPLLFPSAVQSDYVPWFLFRASDNNDKSGRTGNAGQYQTDRGPFTNENITHDVIANLTKVWGAHSSKVGFYFNSSFKPQSIFASFNSQIDFRDNSNNPFDTGFSYANAATGVFNIYQQASKFALPEWRYKNVEWYAQDNWKPNDRLTLDYGMRFYYADAAVGHDAAGVEFPAGQVRSECGREAVSRRCASAARRARAACGAGWTRRLIGTGTAPTLGQYRRRALHRPAHARLESLQRQLPGGPGDHRPAPGRERLPGVAALRRGLRPDRQRRDDRPRRLRDLLRPAAGQHGLRHDLQRAGRLELEARLGTAAGSDVGGRRSEPDAVAQSDRVRLQAATRRPVERRRSAQAVRGTHPRRRLRRLQVDRPAAAGADQRRADWGEVPPPEPGSRRVSRARLRGRRRCRTTSCGRTGATATSGCGTTAATRTTRRCRRR